MDFIHANLEEKLTAPQIARYAAMSVKNLQRVFKKETGQTLTGYIRQARIAKARDLLTDHSRRITDVALEAGYQDLTHFERDFKRLTGLTPREYRKQSNRGLK